MKLLLEIPTEFENDFNNDKFKECLGRVAVDLSYLSGSTLSGRYERETIDMLEKAFDKAVIIEEPEDVTPEMVKDYIEKNINLNDYDLGGCDLSDEDYNVICNNANNNDITLLQAVEAQLYQIREILD